MIAQVRAKEGSEQEGMAWVGVGHGNSDRRGGRLGLEVCGRVGG